MTDSKVRPEHRRRAAFVYVRQSSPQQVERHRESTLRQYAFVERARELGWPPERIRVIDEDLGRSGASTDGRDGFERLAAEIALRRVGLVLGLEVSRLARNNSDWYRLLDLCGLTDTLIGDADGVYHPALYNDRLLLGLKGTMSEAELHVQHGRLAEAIRAKAARGELRCARPVGYVWGHREGEVLLHADDEVVGAIRSVFERFAEIGSVRGVWMWFRDQELTFPRRQPDGKAIRWRPPTVNAIRQVLGNPVYAGAYVFGKTRQERYVGRDGTVRQRVVKLPPEQWRVVLREHHEGCIDWATYEANQARIASNGGARKGSAGAVREGVALLQGLALCGQCGRRVRTHYRSKRAPRYYCPGTTPNNERSLYCFAMAGARLDQALAAAVLEALRPAGVEAALAAAERLEAGRDQALGQWRLAVERAEREAEEAESDFELINKKHYRVAEKYQLKLEASLAEVERARGALALREARQPRVLDARERSALLALGEDLERVWGAATTTARDRKQLLRALLAEVVLTASRGEPSVRLALRWEGGQVTELQLERQPVRAPRIRTAEDTVALVRRLAAHHPDREIAAVLNRQGKTTATGLSFTARRVTLLRLSRKIPCFRPAAQPPEGELLSVRQAAEQLGVAPSTLHRSINDGFLPARQVTPGAPWRIRLTPQLRARFRAEAPPGYVGMREAIRRLGVSRQTVLQWVKRGKLDAVMIHRGRRKGLAIKVLDPPPSLFKQDV